MDELLARQLPHSAEAEQAVLGAMLIDPRCVPEVVGKLRASDFYVKVNQDIYQTIYTMFNYSQVIDPVTMLQQMQVLGLDNREATREYVLELMTITPTAVPISRL